LVEPDSEPDQSTPFPFHIYNLLFSKLSPYETSSTFLDYFCSFKTVGAEAASKFLLGAGASARIRKMRACNTGLNPLI
jgi:hypothetical protein